MPDVTVTISDPARQRLDLVVADYNAENGSSLDLSGWLALHLRELAVQREFGTRVDQLKRQAEDDLSAAINAEKARLLQSVDPGPTGVDGSQT